MATKTDITNLPLEVKQQIFGYCFKVQGGYVYDGKSNKLRNADDSPIDLSLFYTCRSIANACKNLPLAVNTIHFSTLFRDDWRSLAGCFNLAATYYNVLQQDLVLHLAHLITPEMHTQLEKEFPTFRSKLEMERDHHFRTWHTGEHLPTISDNVTYSEYVRPHRCEFVQQFYEDTISDSDIVLWDYQYSGFQNVDRLRLDFTYEYEPEEPRSRSLDRYDDSYQRWNLGCGEVYRCLSPCLRLVADKNPTEFANRVYACLPHWVDKYPAEEFFNLEFEYWAIPSRSQVANVLTLLGVPEVVWKLPDRWHYDINFSYEVRRNFPTSQHMEEVDHPSSHFSFRCREKPRFSAAAVAIRFLATLPHHQRVHIHNIILDENYPAVNNASLHAFGLVPFLKENPLLRVQRHVNVVHCFIAYFDNCTDDVVDILTDEANMSQVQTERQWFVSELSWWLLDALAVANTGISAEAFILLLDSGPHADICTEAFNTWVHHSIARHKAWSECMSSNLVTPPESYDMSNTRRLMTYTRLFTVNEAFQSAIQHMMSQTSTTLQCNFDSGQPQDHHTLLNEMAAHSWGTWYYWKDWVASGQGTVRMTDQINDRETLGEFREIQSRDEFLQSKSRDCR
ncbi:hypothetical protein FHETE_45 [Fusarium heterosporum]|uniref:Uncharacterized protein n=1 Tax=Fusarium heterosporum TaxID=42747 RepID=A0A8H5X2V8_FUSHE|nr:hypothetical protein FHETE_45 [Fusarium heterosporum]